jgi:hypothetical protein
MSACSWCRPRHSKDRNGTKSSRTLLMFRHRRNYFRKSTRGPKGRPAFGSNKNCSGTGVCKLMRVAEVAWRDGLIERSYATPRRNPKAITCAVKFPLYDSEYLEPLRIMCTASMPFTTPGRRVCGPCMAGVGALRAGDRIQCDCCSSAGTGRSRWRCLARKVRIVDAILLAPRAVAVSSHRLPRRAAQVVVATESEDIGEISKPEVVGLEERLLGP